MRWGGQTLSLFKRRSSSGADLAPRKTCVRADPPRKDVELSTIVHSFEQRVSWHNNKVLVGSLFPPV